MNIVEFIAKLEDYRKAYGDDVDVRVSDGANEVEPDFEENYDPSLLIL